MKRLTMTTFALLLAVTCGAVRGGELDKQVVPADAKTLIDIGY